MDQQQQQGEEESCCVPPGFRFHPTEEELVGYYLARKVASQKIDLDIIQEVDLYRIEPWDLQERCKQQHGGGEQPTEWYFFSYKDRKYPSGTRTNRATAAGFWKATGRDKPVVSSSCRWVIIGMRKTLVFYRGRAPNGSKTEWIMHEYRLQQAATPDHEAAAGGWVVCRAFQKPIPNNQIIRPPPFFPSSYAAAGAGYYDYDHHHLSGAARLRLDSGDHHQFLISSSSPLLHHHPVHVPAAAAGAGNSLLYSDDDLLLESKNKHLLFSSILPQLVESPSTASSGIACCSSDAALQTISSSYEHDDGQLIIQGAGAGAGGQAAAAGVIDWNFLDTLLSTTSQLHEPSIGP